MIELIAFISLFVIAYTYFGYPAVLMTLPKLKVITAIDNPVEPMVSILIAAYNEEKTIKNSIESILDSIYPKERIEIVVASDGSTDGTENIIRQFHDNHLKMISLPFRSGKFEAQKKAFLMSSGEIIVLADASSQFDQMAINCLIKHFADPTVGSCVGKKIIKNANTPVSKGDGVYWRYESKIRHLESLTGSSWIGCEGGITAIRKELLSYEYDSQLAQDYAICCKIYEKGYRNIYEPEAVIYEPPAKDISTEFTRKIRVVVRGIQAFFSFAHLLNPIRNRMFFFQNISHRLLRWIVPFLLLSLLVTSGLSENICLKIVFGCQLTFYAIAGFAGFLNFFFKGKVDNFFFFSIPLYFTVQGGVSTSFYWQ